MEDLAPGFRFYPTEEELVTFYLHNKLEGTREDLNRVINRIIPVLDIYEFNPWDLPQFSGELCRRDPEQWFYFVPRQESEARGGRPKRLTTSGFWKATGSPSYVYSSNRNIAIKKTMVFYMGRAPHGRKTDWKMNEYKAIEVASSSSGSQYPRVQTANYAMLRQEFSLCRVYKKSKCMRAFDRRPVDVHIGQPRSQEAHDDKASGTHQGPLVAARTSVPEASFGDQSQCPFQTGEGSSMGMDIDNDSLWDLEQLDLFLTGEDMQLN